MFLLSFAICHLPLIHGFVCFGCSRVIVNGVWTLVVVVVVYFDVSCTMYFIFKLFSLDSCRSFLFYFFQISLCFCRSNLLGVLCFLILFLPPPPPPLLPFPGRSLGLFFSFGLFHPLSLVVVGWLVGWLTYLPFLCIYTSLVSSFPLPSS